MRTAASAAAVPAAWFALLVGVPSVLVGDGWEPWQVGLLLVPSAVVALFVPRVAGPLLDRIGSGPSLAVAGAIASVALVIAAVGAWVVAPVVLAAAARVSRPAVATAARTWRSLMERSRSSVGRSAGTSEPFVRTPCKVAERCATFTVSQDS